MASKSYFDPNEGYFDSITSECLKCPETKCNSCDSKNPQVCLQCKTHHILDQQTKTCVSCTDESRPARLVTAECPELYEMKTVKTNFSDNDSFIEVYLDR